MLDELIEINRKLLTLKLLCKCRDDLDQLDKVIKEIAIMIDMCFPF